MEMQNGFAPYKDMMDGGNLEPGRIIVVGSIEYRTMSVRGRALRSDLYGLRSVRFGSESDARTVLEGKEWYVKE